MDNNYNQLQLDYVNTKKSSSFFKLTAILLVLVFTFVPLAEFVIGFDYNTIDSYPIHTCIVGLEDFYQPKPLQYNSLPPLE